MIRGRFFFFSSRRRHTRSLRDWSSDVCSSDLAADFGSALQRFGFEILSTGGTARLLREAGIRVTEIGDYTGFPEMLDGRVKTLHPKVYAGILARRDLPAHLEAMAKAGIPTIDLVAVNLYPFVETISRADCTLEEAIENIDIGGPTMV